MTATITRHDAAGTETITGFRVESPWASRRTSRTITHHLLQDSVAVFTLRAPEPRSGQMLLRFPTAAAAHAAVDFLSVPAEYSLDPVDPPELAARFAIAGGDIALTEDIGSWTITLPWVEVLQ